MNPIAYNQQAAGRLWNLPEIPDGWPGYALLSAGDLDKDGDLEPGELRGVDWDALGHLVLEFQRTQSLKQDGCLGPKTLAGLQAAYPPTINPGGEVLSRLGDLEIKRASAPTCPPAGPPLIGQTAAERMIAGTWNAYGGGIKKYAERSGIPVEAALAVAAVESGGLAYDPKTGRIMIRFENETMWQKRFGMPPIANRHRNQADEWAALAEAAKIDLEKALKSTSIGPFQVLIWHVDTGAATYTDPVRMFLAYQDSADEQIRGFFHFLTHEHLGPAAAEKNWPKLVRRYNGASPDSSKEWVRRIYHNYIAGLTAADAAITNLKARGATF